jgi:preprotein translocase subunit SecG
MTGLEITLGIILLVMAAFLMVAVMLQSGKDKKSGVISGGAETFFGKSNVTTADKILNRLTVAVSIAFALIVIIMYIVV